MDYQRIYQSLIARATHREIGGYVERHHIIPKCMGGTDDPSNIVRLTAEEHFVAHQLLCKIYPDNHGLKVATLFLTSSTTNRKHTNKVYGWLKRQLSDSMKGDNHLFKINESARRANQEYMRSERNPQKLNPRSGERHHFFGVKQPFEWSDESRAKLSASKSGKHNPYFGQWGWRHSTCTPESLAVWKRADEVWEIHKSHPKFGYSRVSKLMGLDCAHRSAAVLNKIKEGWNPLEDPEWITWKKND